MQEHDNVTKNTMELRASVSAMQNEMSSALNMSPQERAEKFKQMEALEQELRDKAGKLKISIDNTEEKRLDIVVDIWNKGDISLESNVKDLAQRLGIGEIVSENVQKFDTYNKQKNLDLDGDGVAEEVTVYRADATQLYYVLNWDNSRTYLPGALQLSLSKEDKAEALKADPLRSAYYAGNKTSFAAALFPEDRKLGAGFAVAATGPTPNTAPDIASPQPGTQQNHAGRRLGVHRCQGECVGS